MIAERAGDNNGGLALPLDADFWGRERDGFSPLNGGQLTLNEGFE